MADLSGGNRTRRLARRALRARAPFRPKRRYTGPSKAVVDLVLARSGGVCEYPGCADVATDRHHRLNRKSGGRGKERGEQINQAAWILHACRRHHQWVTVNPFEAYYMGWLLHEDEDAETSHVQYRDGVCLLTNDGLREPI